MDRLKEMKDILDEYPYCDNRDIDRDLLQWAVKEIERLGREKEWVINHYAIETCPAGELVSKVQELILIEMQQALKERRDEQR